ncbi:MAG: hypothetical protein AB199_01745 [Parcubacteria bacterium C7867-004]|nr:MAG: hypothetical protein AB199_01745 [Parcubacteria bacterium C7867-004]
MTELPVVSRATSDAVMESVRDRAGADVGNWLKEVTEENPIIAAHVAEWLLKLPPMSDNERGAFAMGPLMVYQLLKAQAVVDKIP